MTLFDQAIQTILEDLSNQGSGGISKMGGNNTNPVQKTNIKPQQTGVSVTAPKTAFPVANKPMVATPGQANNVVPLLQPDGKTPFTNPKTGEPLSYDPQTFKSNPKQAFMEFDKNTKDYDFSPDQKAYIQTAILNSIQQ